VEQLPLHAALARLLEYPVLSDTLPFATLWAPTAPTGAGAVVAISNPTATHAIIDRFILVLLVGLARLCGPAVYSARRNVRANMIILRRLVSELNTCRLYLISATELTMWVTTP
jgi:hypothetical protein